MEINNKLKEIVDELREKLYYADDYMEVSDISTTDHMDGYNEGIGLAIDLVRQKLKGN